MFEVTQSPGIGYKLIDKGTGLWQIQTPTGSFTGSLKQVCKYSVRKLGFEMSELEIGILEMEKYFHSAAEFGITKTFMWTYDDKNMTIH